MRFFDALATGAALQRPAWIPFLDALAAGMEGCTLEELLGDPTRWANALPRAARLVSADTVAIGFLPALCTPAFESDLQEPWRDPGLESLIETAHRLVETVHPDRDVMVALTGPATLADRVLGLPPERAALDALKPGLVKTLEKLCACRPDMVVLDEYLGAPLVVTPELRRFFNTLKNVAGYFNVALGLRVSGYRGAEEAAGELGMLKIDHLILGEPAEGETPGPTPELLGLARAAGWKSLGLPVAGDMRHAGPESPELPFYYTSAGQDIDAEHLRRIGAELTHQGE